MTPTTLSRVGLGSTANVAVYEVPASGVLRTVVKQIVLTGYASTVAVNVNIGGIGFINGRVLAVAETLVIDVSQVLLPGQTIQAWAATAGVVGFHVAGVVVT